MKKILKIILNNKIFYKYLFFYPILYISSIVSIKSKFIEKKVELNIFGKKKYHIDFYKEVKKLNIIFLITNIIIKVNLLCENNKIKKIYKINDITINNLDSTFIIKVNFCKKLYYLKKEYPNLSLSMFLIFFYQNEQLVKDILKDTKNTNDLTLAHDFLNLYQILNFTNSKTSYIKKKEIFNYFFDNYSKLDFFYELINIAEYSLADINILKKTSQKIISLKKINKDEHHDTSYVGKSFYSFGHLIWFIDTQHRKKILGIVDKRKILISDNYISNKFLGIYLSYIYPDRTEINNDKFLDVSINNTWSKLPETNDFIFEKDSIYGLCNQEFNKYNKLSNSWNQDISMKIIKDYNLKTYIHKKPYICFFNRDNLFKKQNEYIDLDSDRTNDPNIYIPLFKKIIDEGFDILYMGSLSQKKINFAHKSFFNYCHSEYNNDYNDLVVSQNCEFFVYSGQSGPINLSLINGKYSLNLEYPFNRKPPLNPKAFYHIRPMLKYNKKLSYEDYFNDELFSCHDFKTLHNKEYVLKNSTSEEFIVSFEKFLINFKEKKNIMKKYYSNDYEFNFNILNY